MSFSDLNLHENILKAINACGYTTPTPVQIKSIPSILEGKDVVASAQTGTGKTAAFVLPALHRLSIAPPSKKTRILILTPTRELAAQITKAASQYGKFLRFNIVNLVGGMPYHQQIRELARGADIIVATPGRLLDHIENKRVNLSDIEMLVLDEADRMLDMGFIDDVEYIAKLTPADRQTLMFSATVDKQLTTLVRHLLKHPVRIDLSNDKLAVPLIEQQLYKANSPQHKAKLLKHFLKDENIFKAIIFCATKISADRIADTLCDEGFAAAALHGDLRQNVRNRTVDQLRRGKIQFLVATDVAARGIDISDVTHVINHDLPRSCEDYVHRIGRTGRAGKSGVAISFVLPSDTRAVQRIERYIGQRLKLISNLDVGQNESHAHAPRDSFEDDRPAKRNAEHHFKKRTSAKEGDRPFRKRFDDDKPFKKRYDDDKPVRDRSDKPFRSSDRGDRPFRSSDRGDKPFRSNDRGDKPFRSSDRGNKPFRSSDRGDKPFRSSDRGDKPFRKRPTPKNAWRADDDKPARADRDHAPRSSDRGDKPFRKPFKKRFENSDSRVSNDRAPERKRRTFSDGPKKDGNRPFKKRSENRDR